MTVNLKVYDKIKRLTVSDLREWLLSDETTDNDIKLIRRGLRNDSSSCKTND